MYESVLRHHLAYNVFPPVTNENAVQTIAKIIELAKAGKWNEKVRGIEVWEVCEDLHLEEFVDGSVEP